MSLFAELARLLKDAFEALAKARTRVREDRERFFRSHVEPVYETLRTVHSDYLAIAAEARRRLTVPGSLSFDGDFIRWLQDARGVHQFDRSGLATVGTELSGLSEHELRQRPGAEWLADFFQATQDYIFGPMDDGVSYVSAFIKDVRSAQEAFDVASAITFTAEEAIDADIQRGLASGLGLLASVPEFLSGAAKASRGGLIPQVTARIADVRRRRLEKQFGMSAQRLEDILSDAHRPGVESRGPEGDEATLVSLLNDHAYAREAVFGTDSRLSSLNGRTVAEIVSELSQLDESHWRQLVEQRNRLRRSIYTEQYWTELLRTRIDEETNALEARLGVVHAVYWRMRATLLS